MIRDYQNWLNENENQIPYFNKADIVGDDEDWSFDIVLNFLNLENDKIVVIDPDSDNKDDYNLLEIMLKKIENYEPFKTINGDYAFDGYKFYQDFENSGKIVKAFHTQEQYNAFIMDDKTYLNLKNKFKATLTGVKYGL